MTEQHNDFPHRAGIEIDVTGNDQATATLDVDATHLNKNGTLHGGVIATMCDSVMGMAVGDSLEDGAKAATVALNVTYMAPAEPGDRIIARAGVRKEGKKIVIVEADVMRESDDEAIAHAVATFSVIS